MKHFLSLGKLQDAYLKNQADWVKALPNATASERTQYGNMARRLGSAYETRLHTLAKAGHIAALPLTWRP